MMLIMINSFNNCSNYFLKIMFSYKTVKNKVNWTGNDGNNGIVQRQVTKDLMLLGKP